MPINPANITLRSDVLRPLNYEELDANFNEIALLEQEWIDAATLVALSQEWAEKAEDSAITGYPGQYSSLHHSAKANAHRIAAETAETNAETAETNAGTYASNALTSETNASNSETAAALSETNADTSEAMSQEWAEQTVNVAITGSPGKYSALHHSAKSKAQKVLAETARTGAETAETNASNSETAAALSETNAGNSETAAALSETNAGNSETAAALSETNAGNSETAAATSESLANEWAEKNEDVAITGNPGKYSALHHSSKANAQRVLSETARTGSETAESLANEWAEKAVNSAITGNPGKYSALHHSSKANAQRVLAETARTGAETAETNAGNSETAAALSETNAGNSETAAATSESLSQEWAEKNENVAITGNPGKYSALHHSAKADAARILAESARDAAQVAEVSWQGVYSGGTSYQANDAVHYLGYAYICKSPTTGNVPIVGGNTWWDDLAHKGDQGPAGIGSGDMVTTNNLSDLTSVTLARQNLGVEIGADVQAYDINNVTTADYGIGNGMDADLLDGQHGSYYLNWTNITSKPDPTITLSGDASGAATLTNLGDVILTVTVKDDLHNHIISNVDGLQTALDSKLDSSAYTAADILTKLKTVDTNGSGLNADTLDGFNASSFLRSNTADTFTGKLTGDVVTLGAADIIASTAKLQVNGFMRTGDIYIHEGAGLPTAQNLKLGNVNGTLQWNGATVWTSANDGTTSGMDADLLDGQEGSYYTGYTDTAVANLVATAPGALDTLNELAAALGDDPNFATTMTNSLATTVKNNVNANTIQGAGNQALYLRSGDTTGNAGVHLGDSGSASRAALIYNNSTEALSIYSKGIVTADMVFNNDNTVTFNGLSATINGSRVLTVADEGSGNGLDADTLDGIQGSGYARLGIVSQPTDYLYIQRDNVNPSLFVNQIGSGSFARFFNGPANATTGAEYLEITSTGGIDATGVISTDDEITTVAGVVNLGVTASVEFNAVENSIDFLIN